jgi:hypothetical protein
MVLAPRGCAYYAAGRCGGLPGGGLALSCQAQGWNKHKREISIEIGIVDRDRLITVPCPGLGA